MKVLHVFTAPQSAYYFLDGQIEYLQSKGLDFGIVLPKDSFYLDKLKSREKNVQFYNINFSREINIRSDINSLVKLLLLFKKLKPDIVHLHTPKASLLGGLAARLLLKKHIIYQMHGLVSLKGDTVNNRFMFFFEKLTCKLSTKIFSVSPSIKQAAVKNAYCNENKITTIKNGSINGIDFNHKFNPRLIEKANNYNLPEGSFILGFVGRVNKDKGIFDFLNVLHQLIRESYNVSGIIIGPDETDGKFEDYLNKLKLKSGLDYIYLGQQLNPEIHMINFDVLLLPTVREGFGLVAAEANSLEIPFVGYDIPGIRDAIENKKSGILVSLMDIEALKSAIKCYYDNPSQKRVNGVAGRERVKKLYKREEIWEALYKEYQLIFHH